MDRVKYLVFAVFFYTTVLGAHQEPCFDRSSMTLVDLFNAFRMREVPFDNTFGRLFLCMWLEEGVMKEDGTIDMKQLQKFSEFKMKQVKAMSDFNRKNLAKKLSECHLEPLQIPEQTAIKIRNCHWAIEYDGF
ncbi:hypothetical protein FQR65_LT09886 [Abscondita terminalis]|nr:hypothetical protein FQR65_LT09886 [Abscondita terminalis]